MAIWSGREPPQWVKVGPGRYVLANSPVHAEVLQIREGRWAAFVERQVLTVHASARQAMRAVLDRLGAPAESHAVEELPLERSVDGVGGNRA